MSDMTDPRAIIGPEGLSTTVAGLAAQLSGIEKSQDLKVEALRREIALEAARLEGVAEEVRKEARLANEGISRELEIMKNLLMEMGHERWRAHESLHHQEQQAVQVAVEAMDKRLDSMNEFRAQMNDMAREFATKESTDKATTGLESRLFRLEEDTRRRFEVGEATARDRFEKSGHEGRVALRPLEDERTGRVAIIAAIVLVGTILGMIVLAANFLSAP